MRRRALPSVVALLLIGGGPVTQHAQQAPTTPVATLRPAAPVVLTGEVDSNSPVVWERIDGRPEVIVVTSIGGRPSRATGEYLTTLNEPQPVEIEPWPGGGVWIEAIVEDRDTWYGFYHNENRAEACGTRDVAFPRIGAARSDDFGQTWTNLGIILDMPPELFACRTRNRYFAGGFGDMNVIVDRAHRDLFIYFSQYARDPAQQGVGVARLAWADRDAPVGKLSIWSSGVWLPGTRVEESEQERWVYPPATPLVTPSRPWHDRDRVVDAFWGPSIHWNTYLRQYVMLLNRASDETWDQEGIYISFNPQIGDPAGWTAPQKLLNGGRWYPQVVGLEFGRGTDTLASQAARFFMSGRSDYVIEFTR